MLDDPDGRLQVPSSQHGENGRRRGVAGSTTKKETAITARDNNAIAERSAFIAMGSLIVAMLSMIISFFALKKRSA
jgi:hypothetical protein